MRPALSLSQIPATCVSKETRQQRRRKSPRNEEQNPLLSTLLLFLAPSDQIGLANRFEGPAETAQLSGAQIAEASVRPRSRKKELPFPLEPEMKPEVRL